ncbi:MAG TPA: hypothetical protein VGF94_22465 [Kofleriaceae bacterium]|jgi:hypothetical protein
MSDSRNRDALALVASIGAGGASGSVVAAIEPFGAPAKALTVAVVTVAVVFAGVWTRSRATRAKRQPRPTYLVDGVAADSPSGRYLADVRRRYTRLFLVAGLVVLAMSIALFAIGWVTSATIAPGGREAGYERGYAPGVFIGALFALLAGVGFLVQSWKVATARRKPG